MITPAWRPLARVLYCRRAAAAVVAACALATAGVSMTPAGATTNPTFSGVVRDSAATPLANIRVTVAAADGSASATTTTDANGAFTAAVPPGSDLLSLTNGPSTPTGVVTWHYVDVPITINADTTQDLTVPAEVHLGINVADSTGTAVAGASVTSGPGFSSDPVALWSGGPQASGFQDYSGTTTDSAGHTDMYLLPTSSFSQTLTATWTAGGNTAKATATGFAANTDTTVTLRQANGVRFAGTLRDGAGQPVAGASLTVTPADKSSSATATTDATGAFALQAAPGSDLLSLTNGPSMPTGGVTWHYIDVPITLNADTTQNLAVPAPVHLGINVTDSTGASVAGASVTSGPGFSSDPVTLWSGGPQVSGFQDYSGTTTDSTGHTDMYLLPTSHFSQTLTASWSVNGSNAQATATGFAVTANTTITLAEASGARFTGTLRDSAGQPIANASITVRTSDQSASVSGHTASTGAFTVQAPYGSDLLSVTDTGPMSGGVVGWHFVDVPITINADTTQDLTVPAMVHLGIDVTDAAGAVQPGAAITTGPGFNTDLVSLWPGGPQTTGFQDFYGESTDSAGHADMYLLPATRFNVPLTASFSANGSSVQATVSRLQVLTDKSITIALGAPNDPTQYAPPDPPPAPVAADTTTTTSTAQPMFVGQQHPRATTTSTARVSWHAPASTGGSPVQSYLVTVSPGGRAVTVPGTSTSADVSGLTTGASYIFAVKASNQIGPSDPSQSSATFVAGPDTTAPAVSLAAPTAPFSLSSAAVRWTATDASSGVASYDVRYRRAAWNGGWSSYATLLSATTATSRTIALPIGYTYCFSVRARDHVGNLSGWTHPRCVARPIDDRALAASSAWTKRKSSGYYFRTYAGTSRYHAALTRTGARVVQVALVATRCRGCGTVAVYVGSTRVGVVKLAAATTRRRTVFALPRLRLRTATISLRVISSGKPVQIDGLGLLRG